jgi:hypothetical protein
MFEDGLSDPDDALNRPDSAIMIPIRELSTATRHIPLDPAGRCGQPKKPHIPFEQARMFLRMRWALAPRATAAPVDLEFKE